MMNAWDHPLIKKGMPAQLAKRWAERIGLGTLDASEWEAHFGRFEPLPGNLPTPLALRYHGHQFDVYNPHLGDGRGFLFGQLLDDAGRLLDLGTKGSGTTPWSRGERQTPSARCAAFGAKCLRPASADFESIDGLRGRRE